MFSRIRSKIAVGLAGLALGLGLGLAPKKVESYNTETEDGQMSIHPLLADKLNEFHPINSFDLNKVRQGTIEEDAAKNFPPYLRSFQHFTHWQSNLGLWNIMPSSITWATSPNLQSGQAMLHLLPIVLQDYYKKLAGTNNFPVFPFGDHSWSRVIDEYKSGEIGVSFGYVFHLISDLTVPSHVRGDVHPPLAEYLDDPALKLIAYALGWHSDSFEVWTDEHRGEIMGLLHPAKIPNHNSLEDLMSDLAFFTGSHFYSDDTIDGTIPCLWKGKYCYAAVDGKEIKILRKGFLSNFMDVECMKDMWSVLGTKAVEYGAGAMVLLEKIPQNCQPLQSYTDCSGNEVWWFNGCNKPSQLVKSCGSDEYCQDGNCQPKQNCTSHYTTVCNGNNVHWQDSCNGLEDFIENCEYGCSDGECNSELVCQYYDHKGCSGDEVWWFDSCNFPQEYVETCDFGCSSGNCQGQSCSNECDYSGQKECLGSGWAKCGGYWDDYTGNSWKECGDYDSDSCLEWGPMNECKDYYQGCENGECIEHWLDQGNGTVKDNLTGSIWQKTSPNSTFNWEEAMDYCQTLSLAGESDWSLPTLSQYTGIDLASCTPFFWMNGGTCGLPSAFKGPCNWYWSSSEENSSVADAEPFFEYSGSLAKNKEDLLYVLCVREP